MSFYTIAIYCLSILILLLPDSAAASPLPLYEQALANTHPTLAKDDPSSWANTATPMITVQLTDDITGNTASRSFPANNEAYALEYYFQETPLFFWQGPQQQQKHQQERQQRHPRQEETNPSSSTTLEQGLGRPVLTASSAQLTRFQARLRFVCRLYRADWSVLGEMDSRRTYIDLDGNSERLSLVDLGDVRFSCES